MLLRDATPTDVPEVLRLVRGLAEYERLLDRCVVTEADLHRLMFTPGAPARALLAEVGGRAVGLALWHATVSTFSGRHGWWLEDIFVEESARGQGIGHAIFSELARRLLAEGGGRLDWGVLKWNAPSIAFYRGLGATAPPDDWDSFTLSGDALLRVAAQESRDG